MYLHSYRYRQISSFGSTIRGWSSNASEMKKLAARDFEDLLQVFSFLSPVELVFWDTNLI